MVIENRPGAGGTIGAGIVAKSPPDGYTLLVHFGGVRRTTRRSIRTCPYDTLKEFVEIAPLGGQPNVLVVAPSSGIKSVTGPDRAGEAEARGNSTTAPLGTGSGTHINAEKFKLATGIDAVHVPYKGTPEALTDTMAGRVTYFFSPISAALPQVKEGKLRRARRVERAQRSSALKDVPTIAEAGVPGFDYNLWVGLFGRPACRPTRSTQNQQGRRACARAARRSRSASPISAPSRCR